MGFDRRALERHAVALSLIVLFSLVAVGVLLHLLFGALTDRVPRLLLSAGAMALSLGVALRVASRLGWRNAGFVPAVEPGGRRSLLLLLLPVLSAVLVIGLAPRAASASAYLYLGAFALLVALHEETWFRGVILTALASRGPLPAVATSAMLFGVAHSANILTTSATPLAVAYQVTAATLVGVIFGSVRLRTGMIWPGVAVHALVDWAAFLLLYPVIVPREPKLFTAVAGIAVYGSLAALGLWMVRPSGAFVRRPRGA